MKPTFNSYVALIYNRFEAFLQAFPSAVQAGRPQIYQQKSLLAFFMWMQFKRIVHFNAQHQWLEQHPEALPILGWTDIPHRTTLSRRHRELYPVLQALCAYLGQTNAALGEAFSTKHLYEDESLFKAHGPVWHQSDRLQGRIPAKLRNLDTDAAWGKSGYHGWVYGYGLHLTGTAGGFPVLFQIEPADYDETTALTTKEDVLLQQICPQTLSADDAYTQASRIRRWAKHGVCLLTPAHRWRKGRYAQAYRRWIKQPAMAKRLRARKTAIEPTFDRIAKLLGLTGKQKQVTVKGLSKVRTYIGLAVVSLQIAMIANSIWDLPSCAVSTIRLAFA